MPQCKLIAFQNEAEKNKKKKQHGFDENMFLVFSYFETKPPYRNTVNKDLFFCP